MKIRSSAFGPGDLIPLQYSRDGGDRSPPLEFEEVPPEARSLVLIVEDPDAPRGTFTHWVVFNIDPRVGGFKEDCPPEHARLGVNNWDEAAYGGPRPPDGEHRYFFKLYALDVLLSLPTGAHQREIERAMETHVVANADLMGRFTSPSVPA